MAGDRWSGGEGVQYGVWRRSPWLMYLGLLVTSGLLGFVWIVLMMGDINQLEERSVFPVRRAAIVLAVGVPVYVVLVSIILFSSAFTPGSTSKVTAFLLTAVLGLTLNLFLFVWLAGVSRFVAKSLGYQSPALCAAAMIALCFVGAISFPILQGQLNMLLERRGERMGRLDNR